MNNSIASWQPGRYQEKAQYKGMPDEWKRRQDHRESLYVRPAPNGEEICVAVNPEAARWVADRLNLAAKYEAELTRKATEGGQSQ